MQNTGEPMPKFFTGLDLGFFFVFFCFFFCFLFFIFYFFFVGKLEGGEKKMQISGDVCPFFYSLMYKCTVPSPSHTSTCFSQTNVCFR